MIRDIDPIWQALLAALFTWGVTALGAAVVFVTRSQSKKLLDTSLGFAAGVMTAASFWSLLAPAIEHAEESMGGLAFLPVAVGFGLGAAFVHYADGMLPSCVLAEGSTVKHHSHASTSSPSRPSADADTEMSLVPGYGSRNESESTVTRRANCRAAAGKERGENGGAVGAGSAESEEERRSSWRRIVLLIVAVTVHNIPEGLAVGVGFGSASKVTNGFEKARHLAIGIGLQNFPEGLAVAMPLAAFGQSRWRAFWYGQLSGMVEPIAALGGAALVMMMEPILPYALAFAAGAMIYVVVDDIIPEAQRHGNGKLASVGCIIGFIVMMCMDVGLG